LEIIVTRILHALLCSARCGHGAALLIQGVE
jgi:hypothetical protein